MQLREFLKLSNLMSLFRIMVIPLLWYFLSKPGREPALAAFFIVLLAAISDGLDGLLARLRDEESRLGMMLDPFADKVFAGALVILLIIYRDFPILLAVLILGRDLLILIAAAILLRGQKILVPSSLTGKYAFAAISVLLACSVIRFEFGFEIVKVIAIIMIAASMFVYGRVLKHLAKEKTLPSFNDKPVFKYMRWTTTSLISLILLVKLYGFLFS
ncbi:MAG: CDP-alcohol phosphatidyltransferase family protein [candidate division Zixibacteria bacterium]|nr:CDP-alcohol phosphatidyltransferase family protein [candidate division Zixibacteria bacterium]